MVDLKAGNRQALIAPTLMQVQHLIEQAGLVKTWQLAIDAHDHD